MSIVRVVVAPPLPPAFRLPGLDFGFAFVFALDGDLAGEGIFFPLLAGEPDTLVAAAVVVPAGVRMEDALGPDFAVPTVAFVRVVFALVGLTLVAPPIP